MRPAASARLNIRLPAWRSRLVLAFLLFWFVCLLARDLYLQGIHRAFLEQMGQQRISRVITINATRGRILDRNGEPLAISTPMASIAATPDDVEIDDAQMAQLSHLIDVPVSEIRQKLSDTKRDFVYLKRQLPPEVGGQVAALNIPGIFLQKEYRRYYPAGDMLAQLIGVTDINDHGQEGIELAWQKWLAGSPGSRRVLKDNKGHIIEDGKELRVPVEGRDLTLSIDRRIQYVAWRDLIDAIDKHGAKAGAVVVLDAHTGEVLAMANYPSFNPNNRTHVDAAATRNRAVTDMYEPGSVMKPFSLSAVLESGHFNANSIIDTNPGWVRVGDRVVHDHVSEGVLTFGGVIQKSSNVGTAKMALTLAPEYMWNVYHKAGFGTAPNTGFPGETRGILQSWQKWRPIRQATIAFGQGITVSLIQLARGYTMLANDGMVLPVSLLKLNTPPMGTPVVSAKTANTIRHMMFAVTQPGGTAPEAAVRGYYVAGKTGTAQKEENGHYAPGKYVASFVGMIPGTDPRLIVAVMVDEPTKNGHFGGEVAAPVAQDVMANAVRFLDIPPDWPEQFNQPQSKTAVEAHHDD